MARTYKILHRPWRVKWPMYWGMVPELLLTIAVLVLFGIQQPDVWRTRFWRIGHELKANSSPNILLYAYANHRPLPTIPFVWTETLTNFNVAISVISLFVLLAKMIAIVMKVYYPIIGLFVSFSLTVLYAVSVYGQAGPDYADPRYPSSSAWYIRMSCDVAKPFGSATVRNCMMSKAAFAMTVLFTTLYFAYFCLSVWAMLPNKELDMVDSDEEDNGSTGTGMGKEREWEMQPTTPRAPVPFTPRTQAFHTLDRKLPLRAN